MLPKAKSVGKDVLMQLGERMQARKTELQEQMKATAKAS